MTPGPCQEALSAYSSFVFLLSSVVSIRGEVFSGNLLQSYRRINIQAPARRGSEVNFAPHLFPPKAVIALWPLSSATKVSSLSRISHWTSVDAGNHPSLSQTFSLKPWPWRSTPDRSLLSSWSRPAFLTWRRRGCETHHTAAHQSDHCRGFPLPGLRSSWSFPLLCSHPRRCSCPRPCSLLPTPSTYLAPGARYPKGQARPLEPLAAAKAKNSPKHNHTHTHTHSL